ncbi:disease resistance protein (CC-NBS-LRR class) family protein [Trifolium medium]|uniref:Disease resistance protein (CC-NBS-LRR class) family protein n=1 Tax=Trifolium medium TaxID=97028 RepID=A0A392NAG8_9FABA|nr:disease resistance protein (CC-NBS-LRR class) family protein [Trifolium medium]
MDTLTALESLFLLRLPKLELSLCEGAFLPPKLQSFFINYVSIKVPPIIEWGLQRLTALSELSIGGDDDVVHTLLTERMLPISLVSLTITHLTEMKCIDRNGLRHLSSLEKLEFEYCLGLESLAEVVLPSSLKTLKFNHCPRLESLPEDRLPSSLKLLRIDRCPVLEARYEYESGKHWSNIVHIPIIEINGKVTI